MGQGTGPDQYNDGSGWRKPAHMAGAGSHAMPLAGGRQQIGGHSLGNHQRAIRSGGDPAFNFSN